MGKQAQCRALFSAWRRFKGDLIAASQYLKGAYEKDGDRLSIRASYSRARANNFKLGEADLD